MKCIGGFFFQNRLAIKRLLRYDHVIVAFMSGKLCTRQ